LKTIIKLIRKDFVRFLNDKPAMLLTFIIPLVLIIIFGNIFGGNGGPRGKAGIILVNKSNSIISRLIEAKLDSSKSLKPIKSYVAENGKDTIQFDEETAREWVSTGRISAAVIMNKEFFVDTSSSIRFKFLYDPKNEIESSIIQGNLQQTIYTQIPRVMPVLMQRKAVKELGRAKSFMLVKNIGSIASKYFDVNADSVVDALTRVDSVRLYDTSADTGAAKNIMSGLIQFDSEQLVGKKITNPGLTRTVGGWAIMFMLFSLTGAATSMFEEKQEGTLKRLLCMPITRAQILWSKYIYSIILGVTQLMVLFTFSWIFFGVDIFSNFGNLLIVMIASAAAAVSFGMLITSLANTLSQASGFSTLFILVMSALGGSWFPVSLLPDWMQYASKATLTYWSVEAFLQVLWRQSNFAGIATNVLILLSIAFLINFYALIRFRKGWM
jgi:ABC-2 type transport system permease protein